MPRNTSRYILADISLPIRQWRYADSQDNILGRVAMLTHCQTWSRQKQHGVAAAVIPPDRPLSRKMSEEFAPPTVLRVRLSASVGAELCHGPDLTPRVIEVARLPTPSQPVSCVVSAFHRRASVELRSWNSCSRLRLNCSHGLESMGHGFQ